MWGARRDPRGHQPPTSFTLVALLCFSSFSVFITEGQLRCRVLSDLGHHRKYLLLGYLEKGYGAQGRKTVKHCGGPRADSSGRQESPVRFYFPGLLKMRHPPCPGLIFKKQSFCLLRSGIKRHSPSGIIRQDSVHIMPPLRFVLRP